MNRILNELKELRLLSGNAQIDYLNSIKTDLLREILEYTYYKKYRL